jgi:hypothetical protein
MQPAVIEWNELTSQSKIYFSDLLPIIFWTDPVFSVVYGRTDHILNGTDHQAIKKAHGIGDARYRDRGSTGLGDRGRTGSAAPGGSRKNLSSIPYWLCQSARPSLNFFRHLKWPFSELPRTCIFPSLSNPRAMPPDIR